MDSYIHTHTQFACGYIYTQEHIKLKCVDIYIYVYFYICVYTHIHTYSTCNTDIHSVNSALSFYFSKSEEH